MGKWGSADLPNPSFHRWNGRYDGDMKILKSSAIVVGVGVAIIGVVGCSQSDNKPAASKSNSPPARAANSTGNPITAPVDYVGAVGRAKVVAGKQVDLATLNRAIQSFQAGEGRFPKDLNEIVTENYLPKIPALPAGMRYQYDPRSGALQVTQ